MPPLDSAPRLLVVDDIEDNRAILVRRFTRAGYEVVEADGGRRALELIQSQPFDAVLLDIMMPEIDGLEVLKRVRDVHSQAALPIIMVSAKASSDDVVEALLLGANDYITKPVDLAVAHARVEAQLKRKRKDDLAKAAHVELEHALVTLQQTIVQASNAAESGRDPHSGLGGTLQMASVLTKICETPALREMIGIIEGAASTLGRLQIGDEKMDAGSGGRVRLLTAGGRPADRHVVRAMLGDADGDIELVEVETGADAVSAVAIGHFDLVIIDLETPIALGLDAIRKLREQERDQGLPATPILAVSTALADEDVKRCLAAGANLHMVKPLSAAGLLGAVVTALSQPAARRPAPEVARSA